MTTYTFTITDQQARVLSTACEVLARLGIGQFEDALRHLPQRDGIDWSAWHADMRAIGATLSQHMPHGIDGHRSNLGIHNADPAAQSAWDLHQVIRHRLAWDRATAEGVTDGRTRRWPAMMAVSYDTPHHVGNEPLATMEASQ